ncbi:4-alpha-glucanotransferase [Candidatus Methylacidithermus pantelleriae]|uniref:4-alpha-glucanotransferase n=1 Tax=Candidatus Methylacidithermus pantelleriae TaxID=2744239 RepID=A0A8J2FNN2_9BACT|nr:4-alpha-glucanotransferase [Candidatus Methylacidithermus pantelleriae]CAF0693946.1 4-alpha-glucanotransferase (amylomaltase) [Candidatus Methylacidithermus pantelleriae]
MSSFSRNRSSGLAIPAFALRRAQDLGIGDTLAVREAIAFCRSLGIGYLQLLPIQETGGDHSPYNAVSSIALDPALLATEPGEVPELSAEAWKAARAQLGSAVAASQIEYPRVKQTKLWLLEQAFETFQRKKGSLTEAFQAFCQREADWLPSYCLFRVLIDEHRGDPVWTRWNTELQNPVRARQWLEQHPRKTELERKLSFYAFVQWVAFCQWETVRKKADEEGIALIGDIPYGVNRYSADTWGQPHLFDLSWSGGSPPEPYFQEDPFVARWGQNWGLPLYRWEAHQKEDFAWWARRIAHTTRIFHGFRLDHVLGFFRIYAFPWEPERNREFFPLSPQEVAERTGGRLPRFFPRPDDPPSEANANAVEGARLLKKILDLSQGALVIAEDLGMVPPYVRPILTELGIPGFTIPRFEREPDGTYRSPSTYPPHNVVTYATHDHPPLAVLYEKLWESAQKDPRPEKRAHAYHELTCLLRFAGWAATELPARFPDQLHMRLIEILLASPCWLAVWLAPDLLGTKEWFNRPGTEGGQNWRDRLSLPLTDYLDQEPWKSKLRKVAELLREHNRNHPAAISL